MAISSSGDSTASVRTVCGFGSVVPMFGARRLALILSAALDTVETVIEIDRFSVGLGEELARLRAGNQNFCRLLPETYVSRIEGMRLALSRENAQIAITVVGRRDADLVVQRPPLQLWRGNPTTRRKVRTLDTLFDRPGACALLVLSDDTALEILGGASRLLGNQRPLIVIRASPTWQLAPILDYLRIAADYEWVDEQALGVEREPQRSQVYAVAATGNWRKRLAAAGAVVNTLSAGGEPGAAVDPAILLNIDRMSALPFNADIASAFQPDEFIATEGLYETEKSGAVVWRWGGIGDRVGFLLEPNLRGYCEAYLHIINSVPEATNAITYVAANGRPVPLDMVTAEKIVFRAQVETPFFVQIGCGVSTRAEDSRQLNIAIGRFDLSPMAA